MTEFLLFNLYGPMASWGDIAVGEQRPSHGHPSKSAILGLLAAALGIRRDEEDLHNELQSSLAFAVRVNHVGDLLRDYHTTQTPSQKKGKSFRTRKDEIDADSLNAILSQRDYRTNASYTIVLWLTDHASSWVLLDLKNALLAPKFTLYLGRKSCPTALPLKPEIVRSDDLYHALEQVDGNCEYLNELPVAKNWSVYWEGIEYSETGFPQQALHWESSRRDAIASRKRWQFSERKEYYVNLPLTGGREQCTSAE